MDRFIKQWKEQNKVNSNSAVNDNDIPSTSTASTIDILDKDQVMKTNKSETVSQKGSTSGRKFQVHWKKTFPWLNTKELDPGTVVTCSICSSAVDLKLPLPNDRQSQSAKESFVISGFRSWNRAIESFKNHEKSEFHRQAFIGLHNREKCPSIIQKMSQEQNKILKDNRVALEKIFTTIQFLAKQNLAIRGSDQDENSNFLQILRLRSADIPQLDTWMNKSGFKWLHHSNIDEILKMQADAVLRNLIEEIKASKYFAVLVDETSDLTRLEQVSLSIRFVEENFHIREVFIGFYEVTNTKAETLYLVVKDVLLRLNLNIKYLRGQCFDGAANVSGQLSGLQKRLQEDEPRAIFVHCIAHRLNLVVQDALTKIVFVKNFIGTIKELITFVKDSPKRLHFFKCFQQDDSPQLRSFCPTRWCVRIKSLQTILCNYEALMTFFEEMVEAPDVDASTSSKSIGFLRSMESFDFYFNLITLIEIFERIESLNKELQKVQLSLNESHEKVHSTIINLKAFREPGFSRIWEKTQHGLQNLKINDPVLPKTRKMPRRYDTESTAHTFSNPSKYFEKLFYEILDLTVSTMERRFDSETINFLKKLENFILKKDDNSCKNICDFYNGNDETCNFEEIRLTLHRDMLIDSFYNDKKRYPLSLQEVIDFLNENYGLRTLIPQLKTLLQIILTIPQSTCTAERSFSALRRIKTYLRSTMRQERLNHLAVLHIHKNNTENLDIQQLMNEWILKCSVRLNSFAIHD